MKKRAQEQYLEAYELYADAIYRHCFFRVFSKEKAQELTQEVFMKTWVYLGEGKEVDNLRAFLYRVATNLIIDASRKKKEESLEAMLEHNPASEPRNSDHLDIYRNLEIKEIMAVIEQLPEDYRSVLVMRYVEDLSPKDIAKIMKTTPNNISVRINRAMQALREKLPDLAHG